MQIKRLLDDREVFIGDKVLDAQGRSYALVMDAAIAPVQFITIFHRSGHQSLRYPVLDIAL